MRAEHASSTSTYDVVITVSKPDLLLEPGMTATVMIVINGRK
jgi:hypothetical protein